MSWGHIVSEDMLSWAEHSVSPALRPEAPYDIEGVFTGCAIPSADDKDSAFRVAYSSVKELPFHWSTPPYPRNAAGLSIATSHDGGQTWIKSSQNPILEGEPADVKVTGFRDPYVASSESLDLSLGKDTLYGLISGGIEECGPTTFLYEIPRESVENWKYLNPLVDVPMRFQPSEKWSGNFGVNWECTNLIQLQAGSVARDFLIIGAEGDVEKDHVREGSRDVPLKRTVRNQLWMSGHLEKTAAGAKFRYTHGGILDHGPYYAVNTFHDAKSGRRIAYGWIPEEDLPRELAHQKGWNGSLALPRELFYLRIPNVVGALRSKLGDIYTYEVVTEAGGSNTVYTMGVRPISEIEQLRTSCQCFQAETPISCPSIGGSGPKRLFQPSASAWELGATIRITLGCEMVGFHINHSEDLSTRTSVYFSAIDETIVVDRHASTTDERINRCPDAGPFTLLEMGSGEGAQKVLEKIDIRIVSDADILEVFVNDRFALATMVYSDVEVPYISAFACGDADSAVFEAVSLWDGIQTT